jgi:hypothetical protein
MSYHAPKMEIICKSYDPKEVDVPTYPIRAHMNFGASSPRVRFLDV